MERKEYISPQLTVVALHTANLLINDSTHVETNIPLTDGGGGSGEPQGFDAEFEEE